MKQKLYITTILVIAILLVINLLSNEFHLRFDLTDEKQYTLSQATRDILNDLEEPVTIKAYFSEDLPPNVIKARQDFQEMLVEYASLADGLLLYEFINPNENEANEQDAMSHGIQPVLINVREKDQVKQQKAFLGATVALDDRSDVIPLIQPGTAMEYALSTAIKKISVKDKPTIGFLQGHGEPPLSELMQLQNQLTVLYTVREVNLNTQEVGDDISSLVIIRPTDSISHQELNRIDNFLARGGNVAIAMNRVVGDLQNASGTSLNTGLESWLQQKGIVVENNFVVDATCGAVTVQQQQGFFTMQTNVSFPFLPRISNFADHAITKGLENVLLEFASSIRYSGDSTKQFTPIVLTSEKSNSLGAPQFFNIQKQWTDVDFPLRNLIVGAAIEGKLAGEAQSKMVVISDGDFIVTGSPQRPRQLQPDNVSLMANSIDWLSDDTGLIALRTKGVTSRPIDELEDSTKTILKYSNFLAPLLLVIGYGLVRMQRNRMKRLKRMSENYEEV
ncbi:MAG: Gldg family protein [Cyclobacteriaceae bacterium]|jgi:gliding-associated putative ABC transporter substrate-binding component GldG